MLTLESLIQEIIQRRGKVAAKDAGESPQEYLEVWSTFSNYVKACLEQKRGLTLSTFCRIGWLAERRHSGKASIRPYFQFSEQFIRSYLSQEAARKQSAPPQGDLCPFEEFNFSKAAIKFSNQLTKDQVFTALRSFVQRLGENIADGREVDVALGEIGRITCKGDKDPKFVFSAQIYQQEGLERPATAAQDEGATIKTAAAFRKEAAPEAKSLGIRGNAKNNGYTAQAEAPRQSSLVPVVEEPAPVEEDYFRDLPPSPPQQRYDVPRAGLQSGGRRLVSSGSTPSLASNAMSLTATQFKRELAYKEAMDRHIAAMEARAAEVVAEKESWSQHVSDCLDQERDEIQSKRVRNQMNLHFLQHQMNLGEEKRKEQRREDIESASAHDFPTFSEVKPEEKKDFVKGMQARVKQDLDDQVRINNTLRNIAKQRERILEVNQLEANRQEMAMLRNAERSKKAYDREALATAWNSDIRMKNIWKAIESHNKVSSHPPQVLLTDNLPSVPPSRGGSTISAGRLMTGSSRKVPLGCSMSLSMLEARAGTGRGVQ
jgi:hypothetical protein